MSDRWNDLRGMLSSADPQSQARAVEELVDSVDEGIGLAMNALEVGPNRYLIAERLAKLKGILMPRLERLLDTGASPEARTLAALLLLDAGSQAGEAELLRSIREDEELAVPAMNALARRGCRAVVELVKQKLTNVNLQDIDRVLAFLAALEKLGESVPQEFAERARGTEVPWQIRAVLESKPQVR